MSFDQQAVDARELDRLVALYGADVLGPKPPSELQSLTVVAADLLGGPAYLTLIEDDVLHAHIASVPLGTPMARCETVCDHVIRQSEPLVVEDLAADHRFATCGARRMGIRSYAGVAVHAPGRNGCPQPIGALCVIDEAPRAFAAAEIAMLRRLGQLADTLLAARSTASRAMDLAADLARRNRVLAQAERLTQIGSWRMSLPDNRLFWSDGVYAIYGIDPSTEPTLDMGLAPYGDAAARVTAYLQHTIETGEPFDFEEDFRTPDGQLRRVRCLGEREQADGAVTGLSGVFQDITDRRRLEELLRRDAATDALTGLANRQGFERALDAAIARASDTATPLTLCMMDLDGFKFINDSFGHLAGDDVLRAIGAQLRSAALPGTFVARLGGDEFAVIVEGGLCANEQLLVARLETALRVPVDASPVPMFAAGTVGCAAMRTDGQSPRDLVRAADAALYAGKRQRIGERRRGDRRQGDRRQADRRQANETGRPDRRG